jgi:CRISPR-associated protein Csh2
LIELKPKKDKKGEQLRSMDDYELDFSKLLSVAETEKISKIKYYTEIESIKSVFSGKNKFEKINFTENNTVSK